MTNTFLILLNASIIFYVSFLMVLWFLSDIVETISKLTKTQNLLKINVFKDYKLKVNALSDYPQFLYDVYPGWITKLLSCPICICFWLTLISTSIFIPTYIVFFIFPINYIISLLAYLLVKKLL